jgi:hypothetical protein
MRTRVAMPALHQPAARRRRGATHPVPLVLGLQRTIGNRATTRLLQREATVAAPHALKDAGITPTSKLDGSTRRLIQAAFEESDVLRPYLKNKFPRAAATEGTFEVHAVEDDFNQAYVRYRGIKEPMTVNQRAEKYGSIGGFFDRGRNAIHLRSRSNFGHALHESMHKLAAPVFRGFWGDVFNEGVTQYFTDCVLREQGLPVVQDHDYKDQLDCANRLVGATDRDVVARAYFLGDSDALRDRLMARLKLDQSQFTKVRGTGELCKLL